MRVHERRLRGVTYRRVGSPIDGVILCAVRHLLTMNGSPNMGVIAPDRTVDADSEGSTRPR
jgi:hypothetical protein